MTLTPDTWGEVFQEKKTQKLFLKDKIFRFDKSTYEWQEYNEVVKAKVKRKNLL